MASITTTPDSLQPKADAIAAEILPGITVQTRRALLLGASVGQFRPAAEVVEEANKEATRAGIATFDSSPAETWAIPQREKFSMRSSTAR